MREYDAKWGIGRIRGVYEVFVSGVEWSGVDEGLVGWEWRGVSLLQGSHLPLLRPPFLSLLRASPCVA